MEDFEDHHFKTRTTRFAKPSTMKLLRLLLVLSFTAISVDATYRSVCYYTNWSQYRPTPWRFTPGDIDPGLCTHLVYAFASMEGNKLTAFEWNDESTAWNKGMYEAFNAVKVIRPSLLTLLAVGGWNFGTQRMTAMLRTQPNRAEFIRTTILFLRNKTFDGIDLDFEYPGSRESPSEDKHRFALLVQEMRAAFENEAVLTGRPRLLVSAAVAAGMKTIETGYDVPTLTKFLDFISIMTYDFHGKWEKATGHNSPLFGHSQEQEARAALNLAFVVNFWRSLGAEPEKMNIGLALYGRSFTLQNESENWVGAAAVSGGKAGPYTGEEGMLSFYEICEFVKRGAHVLWIDEQEAPYAFLGDQWVSFDDEESLRHKVRWMKVNGLGGVMVWALDLDDFRGACTHRRYPLLHAITEALGEEGPVLSPAVSELLADEG